MFTPDSPGTCHADRIPGSLDLVNQLHCTLLKPCVHDFRDDWQSNFLIGPPGNMHIPIFTRWIGMRVGPIDHKAAFNRRPVFIFLDVGVFKSDLDIRLRVAQGRCKTNDEEQTKEKSYSGTCEPFSEVLTLRLHDFSSNLLWRLQSEGKLAQEQCRGFDMNLLNKSINI